MCIKKHFVYNIILSIFQISHPVVFYEQEQNLLKKKLEIERFFMSCKFYCNQASILMCVTPAIIRNHGWHISSLCFYFVKLTVWTSNTAGRVWLNIRVPLPVENELPHVTFTTAGQWTAHLAAV